MVSNYDLNRTALNNQLMGLSTDTKPTTGVQPNSLFWELDTNGMYFFDGTQWQAIGEGGGGGGGGASYSIVKLNDYNVSMSASQNSVVDSLPTSYSQVATAIKDILDSGKTIVNFTIDSSSEKVILGGVFVENKSVIAHQKDEGFIDELNSDDYFMKVVYNRTYNAQQQALNASTSLYAICAE